jgi:hypothetical protein
MKHPRPRGARPRADGSFKSIVAAHVEPEIAKRTRVAAAMRGVTTSSIVEEALRRHLDAEAEAETEDACGRLSASEQEAARG